jgi:hypothetical protein
MEKKLDENGVISLKNIGIKFKTAIVILFFKPE